LPIFKFHSLVDRRISEVQKYNVPIPGQHGNLKNPTIFGSSFIPRGTENGEEVPGVPDDTISTFNRSRHLRNVVSRNVSSRNRSYDLNVSAEVAMINRQAAVASPMGTSPRVLRRPINAEAPGFERSNSPLRSSIPSRASATLKSIREQRTSSPVRYH